MRLKEQFARFASDVFHRAFGLTEYGRALGQAMCCTIVLLVTLYFAATSPDLSIDRLASLVGILASIIGLILAVAALLALRPSDPSPGGRKAIPQKNTAPRDARGHFVCPGISLVARGSGVLSG